MSAEAAARKGTEGRPKDGHDDLERLVEHRIGLARADVRPSNILW
jgi:hypothetical protein